MYHDFPKMITHPRNTARFSKQICILEEVPDYFRFDTLAFLLKVTINIVATSLKRQRSCN